MQIIVHKKRMGVEECFSIMRKLRERRHGKISESLVDWAENEVKLSMKDNCDRYGRGCLESALKAYRSLCSDGHSGFSIGLTKMLLNRLIDGLPLSPVEDVPENWNNVSDFWGEEGHYQCKRMSGLFKDVDADGNVTYHDVDRVISMETVDDGTVCPCHSGWASRLVDDLYGPITMPYYPADTPYRVYTETFDSVNDEPGCYDTVHVTRITDPKGETVTGDLYFHEDENGEMVPITEEEFNAYHDRCMAHRK